MPSIPKVLLFHLLPVILAVTTSDVVSSRQPRSEFNTEDFLKNYQKQSQPSEPTVVQIEVQVRNLKVFTIERKYRAHLALKAHWQDSRLAHGLPDWQTFEAQNVWTPEFSIRNELTAAPRKSEVVRINSEGVVNYQSNVNVEVSCPMFFENFPFDVQRCPLVLTSWKTPEASLQLGWTEQPISLNKHALVASDSQLIRFETQNCSTKTITEVFPCVRVDLVIERMLFPYLLKVFLPFAVCVFICCLSFWVRSSPVRMTLLMMDIILIALLFVYTNHQSPETSYPKYIDLFSGLSIAFVLLALVQFVIVHSLYKREMYTEKIYSMMNDIHNNILDITFRVLWPLFYIILTTVYFGLTLLMVRDSEGSFAR